MALNNQERAFMNNWTIQFNKAAEAFLELLDLASVYDSRNYGGLVDQDVQDEMNVTLSDLWNSKAFLDDLEVFLAADLTIGPGTTRQSVIDRIRKL